MKIQQKKAAVRNILKEDMMKQSDSIRQKLAKRTRNRQSRSMQRLDLGSTNLVNRDSKVNLSSSKKLEESKFQTSQPKLELD